jgi:DNA-binding MarR family transcriptional regulator
MVAMTRRTPPVDIGILLALAYQEFVRQLRAYHAEQGYGDTGRSDGAVFRSLTIRPMTITELGARLQVSKQAAGQIVDDMQRRGYVDSEPDPHDGRARLLRLSERGVAALAAARAFHQRYERRLAREHGREAVDALRAMLESMAGGPEKTLDAQLRALYL